MVPIAFLSALCQLFGTRTCILSKLCSALHHWPPACSAVMSAVKEPLSGLQARWRILSNRSTAASQSKATETGRIDARQSHRRV